MYKRQEDHELFLVMEYVRGASLSRIVRAASAMGERIPPRMVASIVSGLLHGLHAAHEAKSDTGQPLSIVHRDVSPQNVLIGTDGVARVLDFGVAKAADRSQSTRDGQLKGKIAYMAPEQIRGLMVDRRTDVYAAAVVLWEALTGERLFKAENQVNAITKVLEAAVTPPSQLVPGLPESFDRVVMKGLARDPSARYATAREMANDLEGCVGISPATDVGEWLEGLVADELHERAARIAEIERSGSSWSAKAMNPPPPAPVREQAVTQVEGPIDEGATRVQPAREVSSQSGVVQSPSGVTPVAAPSRRSPLLVPLAFAGGVIVLAAVITTTWAVSRSPSAAPTASAPGSASASAAVAAPVDRPRPTPPVTAPPTTSTAIAVDSLPKTKPAVVVSKPAATPAPTQGVKGADCNPPFTTDDKGHVHFKPQCM